MSKQEIRLWLAKGNPVVLSIEEGSYGGQEIENLAKVVQTRKGFEIVFYDRGRLYPLYGQVGGFASSLEAADWLMESQGIIRINEDNEMATIAPRKKVKEKEKAACDRCIFFCREANFCAVAPSFIGKPGCSEAQISDEVETPKPKLARANTALRKALEAVGF